MLSVRALAEITEITADQNVRFVGGQMASLLLTHGYVATSGNNYIRPVPDLATAGGPMPELAVDLLVPSLDGRFHLQEHGGRAFDAAPGLALALEMEPIVIEVGARLLDGSRCQFTVRVPTVEYAVVIKAMSYGSRSQVRDVEDIHRL